MHNKVSLPLELVVGLCREKDLEAAGAQKIITSVTLQPITTTEATGNFFEQDLPNAMSTSDITDKLGLHSLRQRNPYIQACATSGEGLYEGLDWMSTQLAKS